MRDAGRFADVVERPGVHVARLQADDRGAAAGVELRGEGSDVDPALVVGRHRCRLAQAEVTKRRVDGAVPLCTDDHPNRRAAVQTLRVDVPAGLCEHLVPGRGQTGEVRHRRAGDEPNVSACWQPQHVEQPATRRLLSGGRGRRRVTHAGVLVPGTDQPVGRQRRRQRAADHPAEESAARHRHQAGLGERGEQVDDLRGVGRAIRQRACERRRDLVCRQPRRDRAIRHRVEPRLRVHNCTVECCVKSLTARRHSSITMPSSSLAAGLPSTPFCARSERRRPECA